MSVTAIVVQGVFASRKFNQLFALFQEMDKVLTDASIAYQAGQISLLPDPAAMAAGEATFQAVFDDFVDLWIHAWIIWIVVDMIFISVSTSLKLITPLQFKLYESRYLSLPFSFRGETSVRQSKAFKVGTPPARTISLFCGATGP